MDRHHRRRGETGRIVSVNASLVILAYHEFNVFFPPTYSASDALSVALESDCFYCPFVTLASIICPSQKNIQEEEQQQQQNKKKRCQ